MADNTSGPTVGVAKFDFVGNPEPLKADAEKAVKIIEEAGKKSQEAVASTPAIAQQTPEVEAATEAVEEAVKAEEQLKESVGGVNKALKDKATSLKETLSGVTAITSTVSRFMGVLGLVTGALAAVAGGISVVINWSERAQRSIRDTEKLLVDFSKASDGFLNPGDATDRAIDDLTTKYNAAFQTITKDSGLTTKMQAAALTTLNEDFVKQRTAIEQKRRDQQIKEDEQVAQKRRDAEDNAEVQIKARARELAEQAEMDELDGIERINAEEKKAQDEVARLRSQSESASYQADLERASAAITRKADMRRAAFVEQFIKEGQDEEQRRQETERREKESAERIARNYEDAMRQANERINAQAAALNPVSGQVLTTLTDIKDILDSIGSQRGRGGL